MLKVNVGLSRKLSRDYNSTGFSLNLEGEVCVGANDPETAIEKIKEFYDLAEEALNQQIERYQGELAIGGHDDHSGSATGRNGKSHSPSSNGTREPRAPSGQSNPPDNGRSGIGDAATNKQVQYLLNLGKRQGLTPKELESRIEEILGKRLGVYDLTKREAGDVIDVLNQSGTHASNGNGRSRTNR